jgi:hypothetical protein
VGTTGRMVDREGFGGKVWVGTGSQATGCGGLSGGEGRNERTKGGDC